MTEKIPAPHDLTGPDDGTVGWVGGRGSGACDTTTKKHKTRRVKELLEALTVTAETKVVHLGQITDSRVMM